MGILGSNCQLYKLKVNVTRCLILPPHINEPQTHIYHSYTFYALLRRLLTPLAQVWYLKVRLITPINPIINDDSMDLALKKKNLTTGSQPSFTSTVAQIFLLLAL